MGIRPPKGVILYGQPGTGKTLLAKAVANQTSATFLRVVGSELIQKYLGDGPKLVRELFRVAEEHAPSIVFIDCRTAAAGRHGVGVGSVGLQHPGPVDDGALRQWLAFLAQRRGQDLLRVKGLVRRATKDVAKAPPTLVEEDDVTEEVIASLQRRADSTRRLFSDYGR